TKDATMSHSIQFLLLLALCCVTSAESCIKFAAAEQFVDASTSDVDAEHLRSIAPLVHTAIERGDLPGCVVAIGRRRGIVYLESFGHRQLQPSAKPMTRDTVFDMASLTKPIATATSVLMLVEDGRLRYRDKIADFIPEFANHGKESITVSQCLTHTAGFVPDNSLEDYQDGIEEAWQRIWELSLAYEPGAEFKYSDVGYEVLGELVRRITQEDVNTFAKRTIYRPLGMDETGYLPEASLRARAAVNEQRDGQWMQGEVHDPRAFALGGVAGHAGLFSTVDDLARFARMLLGGGELDGIRVVSAAGVREMTRRREVPGGFRTYGWDSLSGYSTNRSELFSEQAFGHGGFTGTAMWIDPELDLFVIFLSNRLHPDGQGNVNDLAGRIGAIAVASLIADRADLSLRDRQGTTTTQLSSDTSSQTDATVAASTARGKQVLTGIDALIRDNFASLSGQRVGLITNHTGRDREGQPTINVLHQSPQVNLVALFSPEHGIRGALDQANIGDSKDEPTGLPIYSLYGESRQPTAEQLQQIDTLVFDIQDIGCRFYTYISTMGMAMRAAAEHGVRFVVLDRPNPISGSRIEGPLSDADRSTFVAYHSLPIRHGMTVGELALMFRNELRLDLELQVVKVEGWDRRDYWDQTNLTWVNPSPNMRSLNEAVLYPGIGLLETTNLSVGRGTDTPFEVLGAPWIVPRELAAALNKRHLPGVTFVPIQFIPTTSKYAGQTCGGVNVIVTDRSVFEPVRTGLEIACLLCELYRENWQVQSIDRLLVNRDLLQLLLDGSDAHLLINSYAEALWKFRHRRQEFLLYD
ncbi:MAG: DUF1343 domain-containing protein, partial [Planctomycetales bacterium]|nr:DUF1343 domain-containing protein [Planctomycetales bacterium]